MEMALYGKMLQIYRLYIIALCTILLEVFSPKFHVSATIQGTKGKHPHCTTKKGPEGTRKEYCFLQGTDDVSKHFKQEQANNDQDCKKFVASNFTSDMPSLMYTEAQGRFGNQLLGYAMLIQLRYGWN